MIAVFQTATHYVRVPVEIARSADELRRGLSRRPYLTPGHGMLFVFPTQDVQSLWMKDTWMPLDMIFVSGEGLVVGVIENAQPETTQSRSVGSPSQYVVEVNAGFARQHGIVPGTLMRLGDSVGVQVV